MTLPGRQRELERLIRAWYRTETKYIESIWPMPVLDYLYDFEFAATAPRPKKYPLFCFDAALAMLARMPADKLIGNCRPLLFALKTRKIIVKELERDKLRSEP